MKIKNLCQNTNAYSCALMMLDLHQVSVEWVDSDSADILIFDHLTDINLVKQYPASVKLCVDLQHASANKHRCWADVEWIKSAESNEFIVIECEDPGFVHSRILFHDFLWNRSKAYYTNYNWNLANNPWY